MTELDIIEDHKEEKYIIDDSNFIENLLIILTKFTMDRFLKEKNYSDLIALYTFYLYTAKWQKTNQIYCTTSFVSKGIKWGKDKVINVKKQLREMGLLEDFIRKDEKNKITGHYIKLNYILMQSHTPCFPEGGINQRVEKSDTNALSINNINALSTNNKKRSKDQKKSNKEKTLYTKLKDLYNSFLIKQGNTQEEINTAIFKIEKERTQLRNLINYFENEQFFIDFLGFIENDSWLRENEYLPSIVIGKFSQFILNKKNKRKKEESYNNNQYVNGNPL